MSRGAVECSCGTPIMVVVVDLRTKLFPDFCGRQQGKVLFGVVPVLMGSWRPDPSPALMLSVSR